MLSREDPAAIAPDTPPAELLEKIRAIYPPEKEELGAVALEIEPASLSVHIEYEYEPQIIEELREQLLPGITVSAGEVAEDELDCQVYVAGRPQRAQLLSMPNLHTVIIPWVGISSETRSLLAEFPHLAVHNLHHNAPPTAELTIALLLAASKLIIPYDRDLRRHDWQMRYQRPSPALLLDGKTALILGYGAIGRRVAAACQGLGIKVLAIKRTVQQQADEFAAEIHPPEKLHDLLPRANFLLICLPLTPQTENLIGARELALLPERSVLVNVGRGPVVDQAALYSALRDQQLHSAGLDVWYNYPPDKESRSHTPPANYPFHELNNVVMSPHRAGGSMGIDHLRMARLAQLLNKISAGKEAPNKVDLELGY
jgi:phosphoglycerate dehydrogenase-like enzyme